MGGVGDGVETFPPLQVVIIPVPQAAFILGQLQQVLGQGVHAAQALLTGGDQVTLMEQLLHTTDTVSIVPPYVYCTLLGYLY